MDEHIIIVANDRGTKDVILNRPDKKKVGEIRSHRLFPWQLDYRATVTDTLLCIDCLQYIIDYIKAHPVS